MKWRPGHPKYNPKKNNEVTDFDNVERAPDGTLWLIDDKDWVVKVANANTARDEIHEKMQKYRDAIKAAKVGLLDGLPTNLENELLNAKWVNNPGDAVPPNVRIGFRMTWARNDRSDEVLAQDVAIVIKEIEDFERRNNIPIAVWFDFP